MASTLVSEYGEFLMQVGHRPELIIAGVQRIHRDVGWTLDPKMFFDKSLTLEMTGYTQTKLNMLQRNYYNPASIARAKADLSWRIKHKKYGSGAFDFRGIPKTGTKQDYCIQSCVISYYPQKKQTYVQIFWRTAELIKRFRADLLFIRDFILPHFEEEFKLAPIKQLDFRFANATFHPMMFVLAIATLPFWRAHLNRVKVENDKMFRAIMYWSWRYCLDTSASIDSYSSARQVRLIAMKTTPPEVMAEFKRYVELNIKRKLPLYPKSVQSFYGER